MITSHGIKIGFWFTLTSQGQCNVSGSDPIADTNRRFKSISWMKKKNGENGNQNTKQII